MAEKKVSYKVGTVKNNHRVKMFGWWVTLKKGLKFSNNTACGNDDNYRFICTDAANIEKFIEVENLEGEDFPCTLLHDMVFRGYSLPAYEGTEYKKD